MQGKAFPEVPLSTKKTYAPPGNLNCHKSSPQAFSPPGKTDSSQESREVGTILQQTRKQTIISSICSPKDSFIFPKIHLLSLQWPFSPFLFLFKVFYQLSNLTTSLRIQFFLWCPIHVKLKIYKFGCLYICYFVCCQLSSQLPSTEPRRLRTSFSFLY